jgi:lantibiotic modifying enzyme
LHLVLWEAAGERAHLEHAIEAGNIILDAAEKLPNGTVRWTIPAGYGKLSGRAYFGRAHGAAGIAGSLLDLFEVTGDKSFLEVAESAGRWIANNGVPVLKDERGLDWPVSDLDRTLPGPFWCHGAAGVGQFFMELARFDTRVPGAKLAERAAQSVAFGGRWAGPTQCHGLAGNIEFLLDMAQFSRQESYFKWAEILARLLEAFAVRRGGAIVFQNDWPATSSPGYMIGYGGIAACFLRLDGPEQRPRQMSRSGFRGRKRLV